MARLYKLTPVGTPIDIRLIASRGQLSTA